MPALPPKSVPRWPELAMWAVFALACGNAAAYTWRVCNALISRDNWIFVDTFLRYAIEGRLDLGDFLVKRSGVDHAQPLNKLLMLANWKFFGLDFSLEGMAGIAFGAAAIVVLYRMAASDTRRDARPAVFAGLMAAAAAVWFSLNSSIIYSFSLVTMGYAAFLCAICGIWGAWHALTTGRWWPLALALSAYALVGDTSLTILAAALAPLSLVWGWRTGRWGAAWRVVAVLVIAVAVCRGFYAAFGEIRGSTLAEFNVPTGERVTALAAQWRDAWKWFAIPAVSGIVQIAQLQRLVGGYWEVARIVLALLFLAAHAWFWIAAWRTPPRAASFAAVALMLLFYAYLAGLLLSRVFVRGADYLDQPRYVSFYQLHVVALLTMAAARSLEVGAVNVRRTAWAAAVALLLLQVPLSIGARREAPYIVAYAQRMAAQWGQVTRDPTHPPADCVPELALCKMPDGQRLAILRMARAAHLNLYSPRFARAHPDLAAAAGIVAETSPQH